MAVHDLCEVFKTDAINGLSGSQVLELRKKYGLNELTGAERPPIWKEVFRHFNELVIWILVGAAVITGVLGDWADTAVIIGVVILNGLLSFFQERSAAQAFAALEKLATPKARVIRDGCPLILPTKELVPGDEIELEEGDTVPADARLIEAHSLFAQESVLTGESLPVEKDANCALPESTILGERRNSVFMGSSISSGRAKAIVVATAMATELGRIAGMLQTAQTGLTPLQKRIQELGKKLVVICLGLIGLVFGIQVLRGGDILEVFLLSVSLAVAAIPEGLPAIVTITLAVGMRKMAKRHALIRRLPSVETLGSVSVICTDKTGTLTRNEMMVRSLFVSDRYYRVSGSGYEPKGKLFSSGRDNEPINVPNFPDLLNLLFIGARCNHARLIPPDDEKKTGWRVFGDPTDGALLVAALKGGVNVEGVGDEVIREVPFESRRKFMSVVVRTADDKITDYTKGAAEAILPLCSKERFENEIRPLGKQRIAELLEVNRKLASQGLRVIALAYRTVEIPELTNGPRCDLIFSGFAAMMDPPREEVKEAVAKCQSAGIKPVMITGDHPSTAVAIGYELGIVRKGDRVVTGDEIASLQSEALFDLVKNAAVYARVAPEHKLKIIRAWKQLGKIVAMTGDGVNDAPAIKEADIGIAMGINGTDVTKEAADLVLLDDNFATIVSAVEEGRGILDNIQKVLHYLLAGNMGELLVMFVAALVGLPYPLLATQILWINLVTDGLPGLALSREPVEADAMRRFPRPLEKPILSRRRGAQVFLQGALIAGSVLTAFLLVYQENEMRLPEARATAFCTLAFSHVIFALNCRSDRRTLISLGFFSNPWLVFGVAGSLVLQIGIMTIPHVREWFDVTTSLSFESWRLVGIFSLAPFVLIEISKLFVKK